LSGFRNRTGFLLANFPKADTICAFCIRALSCFPRRYIQSRNLPLQEGGFVMKRATRSFPRLLLFALSGATLAYAQNTANTPIKHVIVVIQENRTPDNLFQDPVLKANGGDIVAPKTGGFCTLDTEKGHHNHQVSLAPLPLASCDDPNHYHSSWTHMYNGGYMDGACNNSTGCNPRPCPFDMTKNCSQYTYVENSPTDPAIQPYWDIAEKYGFGNYFFQTNQGPSFAAHQFLISGSSVPVYPTDTHYHTKSGVNYYYHDDFVAENPFDSNPNDKVPGQDTGCISPFSTQYIPWIEVGQQSDWTPAFPFSYPCYDHATLTDLLDQNQLSWKYYGRTKNDLWEAPTDISHICQPGNGTAPGDFCQSAEWQNNVGAALPPSSPQTDAMAPVLEDIEKCNLPAVSWVIPDGSWSDHGGKYSDFKGPAWVAAIVNAVGGPLTNECASGESYWKDTVILVTWDDWGGFYDHVLPWRCDSSGTCLGYPSPNSGSQYVYGFRVPLLVISA
jgi:phospholipase C